MTTFAFSKRSGKRDAPRGSRPWRARESNRQNDANWPDWYAPYMAAEQAGTELPL